MPPRGWVVDLVLGRFTASQFCFSLGRKQHDCVQFSALMGTEPEKIILPHPSSHPHCWMWELIFLTPAMHKRPALCFCCELGQGEFWVQLQAGLAHTCPQVSQLGGCPGPPSCERGQQLGNSRIKCLPGNSQLPLKRL